MCQPLRQGGSGPGSRPPAPGEGGGRVVVFEDAPIPEDDVVNLDDVRVLQLDRDVKLALEGVLPRGVNCVTRNSAR